MGRYYCNGKKGYCDRFVGNVQNAENIDCKDCEYADGTGGEYKDIVTNYDCIKSMSVEEMAEFLVKCDGDMQGTTKKEKQDEARDIQQWLLQEARENDR